FVTPRARAAPLAPPSGSARREVRVGRRRLRLHFVGEGPLVLLLHGWQGGASQLASLAESLRAAGLCAVLVDLPAHGEAPGWSTHVAEFVALIGAIAARLGPLHAVLGHGLGGTAALLAGARGVPAGAVVALAPVPSV